MRRRSCWLLCPQSLAWHPACCRCLLEDYLLKAGEGMASTYEVSPYVAYMLIKTQRPSCFQCVFFFFCLLFLFLQWIRQKIASIQKAHKFLLDKLEDKCSWLGPTLSQNDSMGPELNLKHWLKQSLSTQMIHITLNVRAYFSRCYLHLWGQA